MKDNKTFQLENELATLVGRAVAVAVGRAAWGLYILLSIIKKKYSSNRIAIPSFLCQSPLAAVLMAGWEPVFCDVDINTGNVSVAEWNRVIDLGVDAILFVHMFGNVCDPDEVLAICRQKNIFFIEDAAQSLGGAWKGRLSGSFGDASLVSFGRTKLIDVGGGGMVLTNNPHLAKEIRLFDFMGPAPHPDKDRISQKFIADFYHARHQLASQLGLVANPFAGLIHAYKCLLPSRWNNQLTETIFFKLSKLHTLVNNRREKNYLYQNALKGTKLIPLEFSPESVPWRAVFRLPNIDWLQQSKISIDVREQLVDISNWYIPSNLLMDQNKLIDELVSTNQLSREIFQLWLDENVDVDKLERAANALSNAIKRFDI